MLDWSKVDPDTARIKLPNELETSFRDFLLGKVPFPSAVLQVEVALHPLPGMVFPDKVTPRKPDSAHQSAGYFFSVFGITFTLYLDFAMAGFVYGGKAISLSEPPHPIFLTDVRMSEVEAGRQSLEATAKPVGLLGREHASALSSWRESQP